VNLAAIVVALIAAVAFGASTALMHHSASRAPQEGGGLVGLIRHLLFQPRWLGGMVASLIGLGLHTWALRLGSLAVVQPLVVTGLVFAFVFRAALDWRHPPRELIVWVLVTAFGIALFLIGARSVSSSNDPSGPAATVFLVVGAVCAAITWRASSRFGRNHAGLMLGVSGGIVFGLIAGVLKAVTDISGLASLVTSWPVYVLVLLGASGFLINQHSYARAPLSSSLPVLDVVNPVIAVLFGIVVYNERPSGEPLTVATELLGLVIVLAGIFFLARMEEHPVSAPGGSDGVDPDGPGGGGGSGRPDPQPPIEPGPIGKQRDPESMFRSIT
jgi:drug/metabolite transporter (DMT)-like permease